MKENYPVFTQWYQTLTWILTTAENFPKQARFSIASHLINAALETLELIVEAIYTKERHHILDRINLRLEQQRVLFRLAHDRQYLSTKQHEHIANALNETGRMIGGWRKARRETNRPSV